MQRSSLFPCLLLLSSFWACQPSNDVVNPDKPVALDSLSATPTAISQPTGAPVTKTISPSGGTLATPDGKLALIFPAGAVKQETAITLQPGQNNAPNGLGQAFSITPNITFAQGVTLIYYYQDEEVAGTSIDALGIAFQDGRQAWQQTQVVKVDKSKKTVTATVKKASWWALFARYKLDPDGALLTINESLELKLTKTGADIESADGSLVAPLVLEDARNDVARLLINGVDWTSSITKDPHWGSIGQDPQTRQLLYVAPGSTPKAKNPVQIGVELKNTGAIGTYTLISSVAIQGENSLSIDGHVFEDVVVNGTVLADQFLFTVAGMDSAGKVGHLSMSLAGLSIGAHPFTTVAADSKGTWVAAMNDAGKGDNIQGASYYATCEQSQTESGSIQVVKAEPVSGGYLKVRLQVSGRVVTVHDVDIHCQVLKHKTMSVSAGLTVLIKQ
jgi:hypothetical protein